MLHEHEAQMHLHVAVLEKTGNGIIILLVGFCSLFLKKKTKKVANYLKDEKSPV